MGLIVAAIGAGVVGAVGSGVAAGEQSGAARDAANQNTLAQRDTNTINLIQNLIARGAPITAADASRLGLDPSFVGKSSAILPYYLSNAETTTGTNAGNTAMAIQSLYGSPQLELQDYQQILDNYQPSINQANQLGKDVVSGAVTNQMLAEEQPVAQARSNIATGVKDAALQQLNQTLNQIDAIQQRRGYTGDSYGNRMMKFNARAGIMTQAATNVGQAALQNALEKQGIQSTGRQLQLSNMGLPGQMAQSDILRKGLPGQAAATRFQTSMSPLSSFMIGPHNFTPFQAPPMVGPTASGGQIAAQSIGSLASGAGNYLANQALIRQLQANGGTSTGTNNPATASIPAPQDFSGSGGGIPADSGQEAFPVQY